MDDQFKNTSLGEYTIDDMLFNMLSLHDIGRPSKSPLAIGTLVPLVPSNNQTCFVYIGIYVISYQVL